jgi:hypothetical protein
MTATHAAGKVLRVEDIDESTRLLCAGAHLDRGFADTAVAEFLTQPLRSLPPSPGVNSQAVLRECVVARRRRQIRDLTLSALMAVYGVLTPGTLFGWLFTAIVWRIVGPKRRRLDRAFRGSPVGVKNTIAAGGVIILLGVIGVAVAIIGVIGKVISGGYSSSGYGLPASNDPGPLGELGGASLLALGGLAVLPLLCGLGTLGVLWYDRQTVWSAMVYR